MFSPKHLRRVINDMHHDQRAALKMGVMAMVLLPTIFIAAM